MAHSMQTTTYTEKLTLEKGEIYRVVTAQYKSNKPLIVLRQKLNTKRPMIRNLECLAIGGWVYIDPNDKGFRWYSNNDGDRYGVDKWWECACNCSLGGISTQTYMDLEALILKSKYKDFIYTLKALEKDYPVDDYRNINLHYIFSILGMWSKYPQVEYLVKLGYYGLALSKTLLSMNKKKQKEYIKCLIEKEPKSYGEKKYLKLAELTCLVKGIDDYDFYIECHQCESAYHYLKKTGNSVDLYFDYKSMCKELGKDLTDDYWLCPKDLRARHDLVMEQVEAKREADRLIEEEQRLVARLKEIEKEKNIPNRITKVAKKLGVLNTSINGYEISVASSLEDIKEQAKTLNQCLITCNYYKKYAEKECVLVFIKKGDERLATAEVFYNKTKPLGQFYGDERDRDNCLPNEEIKGAFNTWLNNVYLTSNLVRA